MRIQRDDDERKIEMMENMQNFVTGERLQTAVFAAGVGKSIAGCVILIYMLTKADALKLFSRSEDAFVMAFGNGFKLILYIMAAVMIVSLIQNVIALIIVLRGDEATVYGSKYLRIVTAIKAALSHLILAAFGLCFGGMGAFAAFATNVEKDEAVTVVGIIFLGIGIVMVISSLISCVKSIIADLRNTDQNNNMTF